MKTSNKVIATGMSVALALTMTPVVALADESVAQDAPAIEAESDGALTAATPSIGCLRKATTRPIL